MNIDRELSDDDPSGIDMTRDNDDRLNLFAGNGVIVKRIALNADQIEKYNPPPNFAKQTDARFQSYMAEYGTDSWELDALEPKVLTRLIKTNVAKYRDDDKYNELKERELNERTQLEDVRDNWDDVVEFIEGV